MDKHTPCPPPLLWYSFFAANSLFSTQIFQILHITFAYSEGGMDRQGYAFPFSRPLLLPLLFSPSSRPSSPFSQPASPFPWPFLPVSLCPVHFLSETLLSCHRNVYVKLTPQSGQPLKPSKFSGPIAGRLTEVSVYILYIEDVHIVWNWYSDEFSKFRVV